MSVKSSFYNEYDIKNNKKHVLWVQGSFQNHHQTFRKKSDLSWKNWTTGSPEHVQEIWDRPQSGDGKQTWKKVKAHLDSRPGPKSEVSWDFKVTPTGWQDGGDRTRKFTHKINEMTMLA